MELFYSIATSSLVAAVVGFTCVYLLTPLYILIAPQLNLLDRTRTDLPLEKRIPRGGGVVHIFAIQAVFWVTSLSPWFADAQRIDLEWWKAYSLASIVILIYGLLDDRYSIAPLSKLSGQLIAALILYSADVRVAMIFDYPLPFGIDLAVTLLWFVAVTNAFNLIDGIDGLATGLATIAALGVAGGLMPRHLYFEAFLMFGFAGASLGFLRYNRSPAQVYLGDTGSNFIGFTLAAVMLETGSKVSGLAYLCIPLFTLAIPVLDTALAIWRRSARKAIAYFTSKDAAPGIMSGDLEHLHHRLKARGISDHDVTASLCLFNAVLVLLGLLMVPWREGATLLLVLAIILGGYTLFRVFKIHELSITGVALTHALARPSKPILALAVYLFADTLALSAALLAEIQVVHRNVSKVFVLHEYFSLILPWISFALLFIVLIDIAHLLQTVRKKYAVVLILLYGLSILWFGKTLMILVSTKRVSTVIVQVCLFLALGFVFTSVPRLFIALAETMNPSGIDPKSGEAVPNYRLYSRLFPRQ